MKDLFENLEELPAEVIRIIQTFDESDQNYKLCLRCVEELESTGYTCEFDLGGNLYGLEKLKD